CLLAVAGQGLFLLRVFRLGLGFEEGEGFLPSPWPWVANVGLLGLFGASHSGMAREAFKRWWTHLVPVYLERSIYVGIAGLLLAGLALAWQPLAGAPLWHGPTWIVIF